MHSPLPVIHLQPRARAADASCGGSTPGAYACPVYKTPARTGVLSSAGHSTSFLMHLPLAVPEASTPQHWLLRGVAVLCSLDD